MARRKSCARLTCERECCPSNHRKTAVIGGKRVKLLKDGSIPEKFTQSLILDWLKESGLLFWRQNSGVVFAGNRMVRLGEKGLPDIVVVLPPSGRILGLEVKSAKGSLRPDQKEFRDRVLETGGYYRVVRSLEQAMDAVAESLGAEQWKSLSVKLGLAT